MECNDLGGIYSSVCTTPMMTLLTDMHPLNVEKKDNDDNKISDIKR